MGMQIVDADEIADTTSPAANALAQSTLFGSLSEQDRSWILSHVVPVAFTAGTTIFSRGDEGDGLYILQSGGVNLSFFTSDGRKFSFAFATVGAVFGEIAALDGGPRSGDAEALTDIAALKMSREALKAALGGNPRLSEMVIQFLCTRVRDTDQKLEAIALQSVEARLARFLVSAVKGRARGQSGDKVAITLSISPSEISLLIGEAKPQVRAALERLEQARAFHREGGLVVCDVPLLMRIADQGWD